MSLIILYFIFILYVISSYVELEVLFLYNYLGILLISPLKNIDLTTDYSWKNNETTFYNILLFSSVFLIFYLLQLYYYGNFQVSRFLFDFSDELYLIPSSVKDVYKFYIEWFPNDDNNLAALLFNIFLFIVKLIGFVFALAYVILVMIFHIIYLLFVGGISLILNGGISLIILAAMIVPIFISYGAEPIKKRKKNRSFIFMRNYIEVSILMLFFIFIAI
ncbi:MAG: hypothetical protein Q9M43_15980 [Sulfurimonas sp.]|nr:hypothetical protein [Sulfurimonas sp.]